MESGTPSRDTAWAMSEENVEIARRLYSIAPDAAGLVRGDYDDVFLDYFHPDFELVPPSAYPDTGPPRGQEGFRRWYRQIDEIWDDWRLRCRAGFFDAGTQVVVFVRVSGTAKQSGAALAISAAHVVTLRNGRITRAEVFLDRSEALEAAGLSE